MKTLEKVNGDWLDRVLNLWPFALDVESIHSFAFSFGAGEGWHFYREGTKSLFYNGVFFLRLNTPFGVWLHFKPVSWGRFQCGLGWKLNGRIAILLRWQTDVHAAEGVSGPNTGQASGWERGTA